MRLIDADALIVKELEHKEYWMSRGHGDGGTNIVISALEQAPTVPAEIVVHCRDCKRCVGMDKNQALTCELKADDVNIGLAFITPDDYCSYGERRESEVEK